MTTILSQASPSDLVADIVSRGIQQNFPQGMQRGMERGRGIEALNQMEKDIAAAGNDSVKLASAFAKGIAQNPNLERAAGPLFQAAMQKNRTDNVFGGGSGASGASGPSAAPGGPPGATGLPGSGPSSTTGPAVTKDLGMPQANPDEYATPSPFNIFDANRIDQEAKKSAIAVGDPNFHGVRTNQLEKLNAIATNQRNILEDMATKANVPAEDLPRFMTIGSKFDPSNPSEWIQKTKKEYDKVKSNDDKLERAFIPDTPNNLFGGDREKALKNLEPVVQDQVKRGLEQDTRKFLANKYLSATEIETLIHPLTKAKEQALNKLPKGVFPANKAPSNKESEFDIAPFYTNGMEFIYGKDKNPFISYEEAVERAPKQMQQMQDRLSDFFLKNVDNDTSLLVLRDKLWGDKDYDWRQIGPAIREAEKKGLQLTPSQSTEMADVETQEPLESMGAIFQSWDRFMKYQRGNK